MLVNRGWVPSAWHDDIPLVTKAHDAVLPPQGSTASSTADDGSSTGSTSKRSSGWWGGKGGSQDRKEAQAAAAPILEFVGVVQQSENPSAVLPDNVPEKLEFHWIDVPELVRGCFSTAFVLHGPYCLVRLLYCRLPYWFWLTRARAVICASRT